MLNSSADKIFALNLHCVVWTKKLLITNNTFIKKNIIRVNLLTYLYLQTICPKELSYNKTFNLIKDLQS